MIITLIIGLFFGFGICFLCLYPKLKTTQTIDQEIIQLNNNNRQEFNSISESLQKVQEATATATDNFKKLSDNLAQASQQQEMLLKQEYEQKENELIKQLEQQKQLVEQNFVSYKKEAEDTYLQIIKECANQTQNKLDKISELSNNLKTLKSQIDTIVQYNKTQEEKKQQINFYKLNIQDEDLIEIEKLKEVAKTLRNEEPLNKVIWKVYYEKPTADLIGRIVGQKEKIGIYKITNLLNQKCYVGQSNQIGERFKQHIKRGLGAEAATKNKLYPAMKEIGVENFSFEIIQECTQEELNEKELYWQEIFHARDFGYSIK